MNLVHRDNELLLEQFNQRDIAAFGEVYTYLYDQLYYFSANLCCGSDLMPEDVVHDIFIKVWSSTDVKFSTLFGIKAYMLTSIRNLLYNHTLRKKHDRKYRQVAYMDDNLFVTQIVESGIKAYLNQELDLLPQECADVLKYHLEGWYTKEIAEKLNISERTVYNRKNEALSILKSRLDKKALTIIVLLCS